MIISMSIAVSVAIAIGMFFAIEKIDALSKRWKAKGKV